MSREEPQVGGEEAKRSEDLSTPSTALMIVSALMIVLGSVLVPPDGAPVGLKIGWIAVSMVLIIAYAILILGIARVILRKEGGT